MDEKAKPYLQGWAMVENPTDEDWSGVKMALVSGRPISFKVDLYNPLYVDRPVVEPELFASLRPVTYRGEFANVEGREQEAGALARQYHDLVKQSDYAGAELVALRLKQLAPNDPAVAALAEMAKIQKRVKEAEAGRANREQFFLNGLNDAAKMGPIVTADDPVAVQLAATQRAGRRHAADVGRELAERIGTGSTGNAATAAALGDTFQYVIYHPVTLPRQKSALLPIVGKDIEGTRVSI